MSHATSRSITPFSNLITIDSQKYCKEIIDVNYSQLFRNELYHSSTSGLPTAHVLSAAPTAPLNHRSTTESIHLPTFMSAPESTKRRVHNSGSLPLLGAGLTSTLREPSTPSTDRSPPAVVTRVDSSLLMVPMADPSGPEQNRVRPLRLRWVHTLFLSEEPGLWDRGYHVGR